MNDSWDFYSAGRLVFGTGSRYQLESHLSAIQKESRILLITDPNLVQAGVVDQLLTGLGSGVKKGMRIFDGGEAEPSIEVAMQASAEAKSWNPTVIMG
ncbi:MAG: iron-containing alcohol dehydrogenase, partial [Verrucomicrobiota bacterium]